MPLGSRLIARRLLYLPGRPSAEPHMPQPLKTFIIYSRQDESYKNDLLKHLKGTLVETRHLEVWQDGEIRPGEEWEKKIEQQLDAADLFLVLLSIDSLTSEFIKNTELKKALERKSRIVPILIRSCSWQIHPVFKGLQGLPKNMKPVSSFAERDDAWTEITTKLHEMVETIWEATPEPAPLRSTLKAQTSLRPLEFKRQVPHPEPPKLPTSIALKALGPGLPDMVLVKGGTFVMGSPKNEEGRQDNETQHQVTISDFKISKYLVTQKLWQEVMGG